MIMMAYATMLTFGCRTVSPRAVSELRHDPTGEKTKLMNTVSDLVDLYVFPSPRQPERLVLALTTSSVGGEQSFFSDRVNYMFYLRDVGLSKSEKDAKLTTRDVTEKVIMCWFETPKDLAKHRGTCSLPQLGEVSGKLGEVSESKGVSFYHGLRRDPYMADLDLAARVVNNSSEFSQQKKNQGKANVLSLVLEFKPEDIFGRKVKLAAVAAQSYTTSNTGQQKPLDRVGRPGVFMLMSEKSSSKDPLWQQFKLDRPFGIPDTARVSYEERVTTRLAKIDKIDQKSDWDDSRRRALTGLLIEDYILFDASKLQSQPLFFAIEDALLSKKTPKSFGGRGLNGDSFGGFLKLLVTGGEMPKANTSKKKKVVLKFPYLQEPNAKAISAENLEITRPSVGSF